MLMMRWLPKLSLLIWKVRRFNLKKRYFASALIVAIIINITFLGLIGYAWYHASHQAAAKSQPQKIISPAPMATNIVSSVGQPMIEAPSDAVVNKTFHGQVHIEKTFVGPGHLNGLVLALKKAPTEKFIAYYDPTQKLLYLGQVVNAKGQNTTLKAVQTYLSDPEKPIIIKAFSQIPAVITGAKQPKHTITIVIDPNSSYFRTLYQNFLLDTQQAGLQIRWILVNYLKPMGPNLAGWILSGNQPGQRLIQVASAPSSQWTNFMMPALSQKVINTLRDHWNLMQAYHLVPGPVTLFNTNNRHYVIKGLVGPESFDQILPQIILHSN